MVDITAAHGQRGAIDVHRILQSTRERGSRSEGYRSGGICLLVGILRHGARKSSRLGCGQRRGRPRGGIGHQRRGKALRLLDGHCADRAGGGQPLRVGLYVLRGGGPALHTQYVPGLCHARYGEARRVIVGERGTEGGQEARPRCGSPCGGLQGTDRGGSILQPVNLPLSGHGQGRHARFRLAGGVRQPQRNGHEKGGRQNEPDRAPRGASRAVLRGKDIEVDGRFARGPGRLLGKHALLAAP